MFQTDIGYLSYRFEQWYIEVWPVSLWGKDRDVNYEGCEATYITLVTRFALEV